LLTHFVADTPQAVSETEHLRSKLEQAESETKHLRCKLEQADSETAHLRSRLESSDELKAVVKELKSKLTSYATLLDHAESSSGNLQLEVEDGLRVKLKRQTEVCIQ
jgi:predicted nuclease with TOPRIM domain